MKEWNNLVPQKPKFNNISKTSNIHLDLQYILPNLAACSKPVDTRSSSLMNIPYKKLINNDIYELIQVLNDNHGKGNWKIINLQAEKINYEPSTITNDVNGGAFQRYFFIDHGVVTFNIILKILKDLEEYLNLGAEKVVVIHCKHGKGRTGSIVVGYLMYKFKLSFNEANLIFIDRRKLYKTGVSINSQIRYLKYLEKFLNSDKILKCYKKIVMMRGGSGGGGVGKGVKIELTELAIVKPDELILKSVDNLSIEVHEITDRETSIKQFLTKLTNDNISHSSTDKIIFKTTTCNDNYNGSDDDDDNEKSLLFNETDVLFEIKFQLKNILNGGIGRSWINLLLEYIINYTTIDNNNILNIRIPWNQMDGFKGTRKKGLNLLAEIELNFKFTFNDANEFKKLRKLLLK